MEGWKMPAQMSSETPVVGRCGAERHHFASLRASSSSTSASSVTFATSPTFRPRNLHHVRCPRCVTSWPTRAPQCATSNAPLCRFGLSAQLHARRADGETEPKASRARREPVQTRAFAFSPIASESFPTGSMASSGPSPNPTGCEAGSGMTRAWVARRGGGFASAWSCPSGIGVVSWWPSASCVGQRTSGRVRSERSRAACSWQPRRVRCCSPEPTGQTRGAIVVFTLFPSPGSVLRLHAATFKTPCFLGL